MKDDDPARNCSLNYYPGNIYWIYKVVSNYPVALHIAHFSFSLPAVLNLTAVLIHNALFSEWVGLTLLKKKSFYESFWVNATLFWCPHAVCNNEVMNLAKLTESEVNIWRLFSPSESYPKNLWLERQAHKEVLHISIYILLGTKLMVSPSTAASNLSS